MSSVRPFFVYCAKDMRILATGPIINELKQLINISYWPGVKMLDVKFT